MASAPSLPTPPPTPLPGPIPQTVAMLPIPIESSPLVDKKEPIVKIPEPQYAPPLFDPLAGFFSYLIPGLGQVYQGRIGKGILFFVGLYGLFFYGMSMGQWRNVWLPDATELPEVELAFGYRLNNLPKALSYRPQYAMQFCMGTAAWPAILQYAYYDKDLKVGPFFGAFERAPTEEELNALQRDRDTRWDLGWVYTVIAGALNLLVIYDAFAGPMFREIRQNSTPKNDTISS